ncbi:MAG: RNA-directed DNA polymerase, partial [Candidatus Electrothrix sp. ATG2]|nr:RNA-directed DNA polymerase [Candidatus Electrothrix sp. ATG2]
GQILSGRYWPGEYSTFQVRDPKPRQICAAPFHDRVVFHAVCNVLEPLFERRLIFDSWACRRGKGSHAAIKRAQYFSRRHEYFLQGDVHKYFDSIDHASLKILLRRIIKDKRLLALLDRIINHAPPGLPPGKGLPIGNLTSQHFANLYLGELDHFIKEVLHVRGYVRYMDDILLFADNKPTLHNAFAELKQFLAARLQLALKNENVIPTPVSEGIPFLGFRIFPAMIRLDRRTLRRFRRRFRHHEQEYLQGDLDADQLNSSVTAMFAHIDHGDTFRLRRKIIQDSLFVG